jgi:two-component system, NarL family, sensor histidine kinase DegS
MSLSPDAAAAAERFRALESETRRDLDHTREQLTEIQLLLKQTENEVDKLAQRESAIISRVRDMEINLENYTRTDIKSLYTSGQEIGLRLFMMRGQVEQLQMRQQHVTERQSLLGTILSLLNSMGAGAFEPAAADAAAAPTADALAAAASLGKVIEAQEIERQRAARYLHDGPAQTLTNLVLKAEICEHMIDRDTNEAKAELQALRASLTNSLQEARRLIFSLRPMILDDIGLVPTLRRYFAEVGRGAGFSHTVRGPETDETLEPPVRSLLFRLVQDVVTELAGRGSLEQVAVDLALHEGGGLELRIEARASHEGQPPALDEVLAQETVAQRLYMLAASSEVALVGERGAQVVITAMPPAA